MANIVVLGAGGFGIALSVMTDKQGHAVTLWSPFEAEIALLNEQRENKKLLPGVILAPSITLTSDVESTAHADVLVVATPSFAVRSACQAVQKTLSRKAVVVCVAKGFEPGTLKSMSEIIEEELPDNQSVILSGPSHAEEVALGVPTTVVAASRNRGSAEYIQDTLMNDKLRIYVNDDVTGVELGGALKNVIALAVGVCDGLGLGDNSKAALMTRGITEIARLGIAMGAKSETFAGLAGIGDLIVTCTSMHSRNRRAGILIGQGKTAEEAIKEVGMTVEGYVSSKCAYELAHKIGVDMPIIEQVYEVLYQGKSAKQAVMDLMDRPKRHESEVIWLLSK